MKGVYILRLKGDRYYVGYSADIDRRIEQHFSGNGAAWTKKYKPVEVKARMKGLTEHDERIITKALMATYGADKVRGGTFTQSANLTPSRARVVQKQLSGALRFDGRCNGTTKQGKRCRIMTGRYSFCSIHKEQHNKRR